MCVFVCVCRGRVNPISGERCLGQPHSTYLVVPGTFNPNHLFVFSQVYHKLSRLLDS